MNIDDMVSKFVEISRAHNQKDDFSENEYNRIKTIYDNCLSSIIKNFDAEFIPSLIICNTYNKYSTVLPVKMKQNKYKYYVLYDRYLNEINRLFNAIYFDENDAGHDIWKLSYELFAEDALLENDEVLLTYYGLNKVALGPLKTNVGSQNFLDFISDIQEHYIIGHELGHWVYKVLNHTHTDDLFNINFNENWISLLKDIQDILCELYTEYEKEFIDKDYVILIQEQKSIINEHSGVLEECFADAIAYAIIYNYIQVEFNNEINKKLLAGQALFLEIMNLQLLAMQHMTVSEESFESSVSIRLGFFRNYVGLYFEQVEKSFEEMIQNTVVRYENRITNLMIECFNELEKRADNIYDGLIDIDGLINMSKILGVSDTYKNSDLI
jgi:hypothetical protein